MSRPTADARTGVVPFALKDAPALIERLLPVQKLSAEAYKEQMAGRGKTLTASRLLLEGQKAIDPGQGMRTGVPVARNERKPTRDLEIFEMLMGMDDLSFAARAKRKPKPKEIIAKLSLARIEDYFQVAPPDTLPQSAPVDWSNPAYEKVKVSVEARPARARAAVARSGNAARRPVPRARGRESPARGSRQRPRPHLGVR